MPKDVKDLAASRREEIVNACETLYKTKSFKDITIKDIGGATTFTRTSVYNYFETKEEIFLALLTREYLLWVSDLQTLLGESVLSRKEYAEALARSLQARPVMLKLLSVNMYEIEGNSRIERLTEFKKAYGAAIKAISQSFVKSFPERGERGAESFVKTYLSEESGGPPRKYYSITQTGLNEFQEDSAEWLKFAETVNKIIKGDN